MLKIAICDDDMLTVKEIRGETEKYFNRLDCEYTIMTFDDGEPLVRMYEGNDKPFDLVILDIKLKNLNGDDASKIIRSHDSDVIIIFISSWISYAVFGYEVDARRFIQKDVSQSKDDLVSALDGAYQLLQARKKYILIHQNESVVRVGLHDILYIEALNKSLVVHCNHGEYQFHSKLSIMERELAGTNISRCHRSYLVNVEHITAIKKEFLQLTGGIEVPVSRPYRKIMFDKLTNYLGASI